jgi:anti-anti-sigma factor
MLVDVLHRDEFCILQFHGRFASGAQLEYLERKLADIRALGTSKVGADLSNMTSIGSAGLGFMVSVFTSVTNRPCGRFVMFGANPRVKQVFDVTRLSEIIPSAPDLEGAVAALREASPAPQESFRELGWGRTEGLSG